MVPVGPSVPWRIPILFAEFPALSVFVASGFEGSELKGEVNICKLDTPLSIL